MAKIKDSPERCLRSISATIMSGAVHIKASCMDAEPIWMHVNLLPILVAVESTIVPDLTQINRVFPADAQGAPQTPSRRQMQQQLPSMPTMPEQQAIVDMAQWGQPVGWPLGPRAQQPYPAVSVSSVGSVMSAFRRLDVQHVRPLPNRYCLYLARTLVSWQLSGQNSLVWWRIPGMHTCTAA